MRPTPISLRELSQELTGIRLNAVNNSIWQISNIFEDRARIAMNNAIRSYPIWIEATETSISFSRDAPTVALPKNIEHVKQITAFHASDSSHQVEVTYFRHFPTETTNILRAEIPGFFPTEYSVHRTGSYWLTIDYRFKMTELPAKQLLHSGVMVASLTPVVRPMNPHGMVGSWLPSGYVELIPANEYANEEAITQRELLHYNSIDPTVGLSIDLRNQLGTQSTTDWATDASVYIYPVAIAPPEMLSVIMDQAQANMYDYWVGNRAMYDQYVTLANVQQMDVDELLRLVRTYELRAQEKWDRLFEPMERKLPKPGRMNIRRRKDVNP